jgi:hypothetical protein
MQAILRTVLRGLLPAPLAAAEADSDDAPVLLARQGEQRSM